MSTSGLKIRSLNRGQARRRFSELVEAGFVLNSDPPPELSAVRERMAGLVGMQFSSEIAYDLEGGTRLYDALPPGSLALRDAADDGVWRHLSLDVLPDVVQRRAEGDERWFWSGRWRMWPKRVWWWIHLGWQGNLQDTKRALQSWTTDTVAQFVERPGQGFRVDLWRLIAKEAARQTVDQHHFRRVMKLNTALVATVEPGVDAQGAERYARHLFDATANRP